MSDLDLLRSYLEGALDQAGRRRVEERCAADSGFADLFAAYRAVHDLTPPPALPPCGETLGGFRAARGRARARRPALAAAALLLAGLSLYLAWPGGGSAPPRAPLGLSAIPLAPVAVPPLPEIPAALASYAPQADGRLHFLDDLPEARSLARFTGRPLLIYLHVDGCPLCAAVESHVFTAPEVRRAASSFVLVKGDYFALSPSLLSSARYSGPVCVIEDSSGKALGRVRPYARTQTVAAALSRFGSLFDWSALRRRAAELAEAEGAHSLAKKYAVWNRVAAEDAKGPLGARARSLLAGLSAAAGDAVREARARTQRDGAAAAARWVRHEARTYEGTPFAADFRRLAERIEQDRKFPELEESR